MNGVNQTPSIFSPQPIGVAKEDKKSQSQIIREGMSDQKNIEGTPISNRLPKITAPSTSTKTAPVHKANKGKITTSKKTDHTSVQQDTKQQYKWEQMPTLTGKPRWESRKNISPEESEETSKELMFWKYFKRYHVKTTRKNSEPTFTAPYLSDLNISMNIVKFTPSNVIDIFEEAIKNTKRCITLHTKSELDNCMRSQAVQDLFESLVQKKNSGNVEAQSALHNLIMMFDKLFGLPASDSMENIPGKLYQKIMHEVESLSELKAESCEQKQKQKQKPKPKPKLETEACGPMLKLCYDIGLEIPELAQDVFEGNIKRLSPKKLIKQYTEEDLKTLFKLAAEIEDVDTMNKLLKTEKCDDLINYTNGHKKSPLLLFAEKRNCEYLSYILGKENLNTEPLKLLDGNDYLIYFAVLNNHSKLVQQLLKLDFIKVKKRDIDGNSALHLAAKKGHLSCVKRLCEAKENDLIHLQNCSYHTALQLSALNGKRKCTEYLYNKGLSPTTSEKPMDTNLLESAIKGNNKKIIKWLIQNTNYLDRVPHKELYQFYQKASPESKELLKENGIQFSPYYKIKQLFS